MKPFKISEHGIYCVSGRTLIDKITNWNLCQKQKLWIGNKTCLSVHASIAGSICPLLDMKVSVIFWKPRGVITIDIIFTGKQRKQIRSILQPINWPTTIFWWQVFQEKWKASSYNFMFGGNCYCVSSSAICHQTIMKRLKMCHMQRLFPVFLTDFNTLFVTVILLVWMVLLRHKYNFLIKK